MQIEQRFFHMQIKKQKKPQTDWPPSDDVELVKHYHILQENRYLYVALIKVKGAINYPNK